MRIDVVTLFPELVGHAARFGVTGRALERGLVAPGHVESARLHATDNHRTVDDRPYGGGPGMVMLARTAGEGAGGGARRAASGRRRGDADDPPVAGGHAARRIGASRSSRQPSSDTGYVLLAGRYEGIDERFVDARGRRGDRDRRFRRLGRRVAGADADRRDRAAAAGRAERCRIGGAGFVRRRAARLPALHAARALRRASACPRCCCRGTTRRSAAGG